MIRSKSATIEASRMVSVTAVSLAAAVAASRSSLRADWTVSSMLPTAVAVSSHSAAMLFRAIGVGHSPSPMSSNRSRSVMVAPRYVLK